MTKYLDIFIGDGVAETNLFLVKPFSFWKLNYKNKQLIS